MEEALPQGMEEVAPQGMKEVPPQGMKEVAPQGMKEVAPRSSPVEWCNRFVSFGLGYALSWSGVSSCWVGCGVSRDLVRMSRLR